MPDVTRTPHTRCVVLAGHRPSTLERTVTRGCDSERADPACRGDRRHTGGEVFDLGGRGSQWCRTRPGLLAERRCGRRDGGGWGWVTRPASQSYRVEPGRVRSGDHPQMRLAFRRCLLTSWWHMQIEDLIFEDDVRGYFENGSDLDAFIVAGVDDGDVYYCLLYTS